MCCNEPHDSITEDLLVAFATGLAAIIKTAWWLTTRVAAPLLAALAVLAYRWTTGLPLLPDRVRSTPALFNRGVRAAGRDLVTAITIGVLLNPWLTILATTAVLATATATIAYLRARVARRTGPRRVAATTGTPTRLRRVRYAVTDRREDTTWTDQAVRNTGRAA